MVKKSRSLIFLLAAYVLIFFIGYRAGEINNRLKRGVNVQKVAPENYYMVEEIDYGNYHRAEFYEINSTNLIMKFYNDPRLKPLLKLRNIKIYKNDGERIY